MNGFIIERILPAFLKDNADLAIFLVILTYALLLTNFIVNTDWESKLHGCSFTVCAIGLLYLHYSKAELLEQYENPFVTVWVLLLLYHSSTWKNNYQKVREELSKASPAASLRRFQGSVFRFFITLPTTKNASNQWNPPPFRNAIHVLLILGYGLLLMLHIIPFVTPIHCLSDPSPLCCRYNYVIAPGPVNYYYDYKYNDKDAQPVSSHFCAGRVRVALAGSWSTGKTFLLAAILGHPYATAQISPAPSTDKFVCITTAAPYQDPIRSDDYVHRQHCELLSHVNDVTHKACGSTMTHVLDVADTNTEFAHFVFFDMPGWQREYGEDCRYRVFYKHLIDQVDYTFVVCKYNSSAAVHWKVLLLVFLCWEKHILTIYSRRRNINNL